MPDPRPGQADLQLIPALETAANPLIQQEVSKTHHKEAVP